ncbi:hypothetical protein H0H93_003577, partial [Arthromyces matolae]
MYWPQEWPQTASSSQYPFPGYIRTPYLPSTPRRGTPFLPDMTLYPHSPYSNHASPNRGCIPLPDPTTPNTPHLDLPPVDPYDSESPWYGYRRERRPSWQGFRDVDFWPQSAYPGNASGRQRRHSFVAPTYQRIFASESTFSINPWINGESPRPDLFVDLALSEFYPIELSREGFSRPLPAEELMQPATQPFVTRMKIVFDFPQWPCYIYKDPSDFPFGYEPPPITLNDVLLNLHHHLHTQVSQDEFAKLPNRKKAQIAEAFTERCLAIPDGSLEERAR